MEGHARCRHDWEVKGVRRVDVLVTLWDCGRCHSSRIAKLNVPAELTERTLTVSLDAFVALLDEARRFDQRYPELGQTRWLTGSSWVFSDQGALFKSSR